MTQERVLTRVFRIDRVLGLHRDRPAPDGAPAVLVIPRGGPLRTPRLVVFDRPGTAVRRPPGRLVAADAHTVARFDGPDRRDRRETADVLVGRSGWSPVPHAERLRRVLGRYPGCAAAVGETGWGCVTVLREGPRLRMSGPVDARRCGSLLYGWTAAGLPVAALAGGLLVAGTLPRAGGLDVTGRLRVDADAAMRTGRAS